MSATDKTYDAKHGRLPGKADSRETLKALARVLARRAAAEAARSLPSNGHADQNGIT